MGSRKLSSIELKVHQTALSAPSLTLSQREIDALIPDGQARVTAINFLLGTGLIRALRDAKGSLSYRAIGKKELDVKKDLSGEERLVLSHIQAATTEGIWTKHLKAKTELHQTVIDRCLKTLVQKQIIKSVTNVKHRTRKTYMMAHLEPSVAITGGPWYTENELDTEFISLLTATCLRFIRERSFPKSKSEGRRLYPISASPNYPTAQQILQFVAKSRITETDFSVEHIEMLLNVLVADGEVERLPAFGIAMWDANTKDDDDEEMGSEDEAPTKKRKKASSSDKGRKKRRKTAVSSESDRNTDDDTSKGGTTTDDDARSSRKSKGKKKNTKVEEESEHEIDISASMLEDFGGANVYRAVRKEQLSLGWSQAPCGPCKQFTFCNERGPVNPKGCEYYGKWLTGGVVEDK